MTSALLEPGPGTEVDEFEARLQHAVEALTMEVGPGSQADAPCAACSVILYFA